MYRTFLALVKAKKSIALVAAVASLVTSATHMKPKDWHGKVESRFLSSKLLAVEVGSVINTLRAVFEPELKNRAAGNVLRNG